MVCSQQYLHVLGTASEPLTRSIESLSRGIILCNASKPGWPVVYVTTVMARLANRQPAELVGKFVADLFVATGALAALSPAGCWPVGRGLLILIPPGISSLLCCVSHVCGQHEAVCQRLREVPALRGLQSTGGGPEPPRAYPFLPHIPDCARLLPRASATCLPG